MLLTTFLKSLSAATAALYIIDFDPSTTHVVYQGLDSIVQQMERMETNEM